MAISRHLPHLRELAELLIELLSARQAGGRAPHYRFAPSGLSDHRMQRRARRRLAAAQLPQHHRTQRRRGSAAEMLEMLPRLPLQLDGTE